MADDDKDERMPSPLVRPRRLSEDDLQAAEGLLTALAYRAKGVQDWAEEHYPRPLAEGSVSPAVYHRLWAALDAAAEALSVAQLLRTHYRGAASERLRYAQKWDEAARDCQELRERLARVLDGRADVNEELRRSSELVSRGLLDWVELRYDQMIRQANMWGSPEALELQLLQLLEMEMMVRLGRSGREVIEAWSRYLRLRFGPEPIPLYSRLILAGTSSPQARDIIVDEFMKFRQGLLERLLDFARGLKMPGAPPAEPTGPGGSP